MSDAENSFRRIELMFATVQRLFSNRIRREDGHIENGT